MSAPAAATPQQNIQLLRQFLNFLNDAGLAALDGEVDAFVHPEIEWTPGMLAFGQGTYRGQDEYRRYLQAAIARAGDGSYMNIKEIRAVGVDQVLALAWVHYSGDEGPQFDGEYALIARIEDGQIRVLRSFLSYAEAEREAANA